MAENPILLEKSSIKTFICEFEKNKSQNNNLTKLELELKKLEIIKYAHQIISKAIDTDTISDYYLNIKKETNIFKMLLYYLFLLGGLAEQISGSYIYAYTFFALIPALSNFWLIIISVVYTVLDCVLFYAFQADLLKTALGLEFGSNDSSQLLKIYEEQLSFIILMNESLINPKVLDKRIPPTDYEEYVALVQLFNNDLCKKNDSMNIYKESISRKMFKYGMYAFGVLSTVASGYFTATALLSAISGGLVGTPIGWIITILLIVSGLAFYCAMEGKSLFHLVNPDYALFKDLQARMSVFSIKWPQKLSDSAAILQKFLPENEKPLLTA